MENMAAGQVRSSRKRSCTIDMVDGGKMSKWAATAGPVAFALACFGALRLMQAPYFRVLRIFCAVMKI